MGEKDFLEYPAGYNDSDLVWASPFLTRHGIVNRLEAQPDGYQGMEKNSLHNAEVFHLLYPVRLVCTTKGLISASHLWSLLLKIKNKNSPLSA
jgi:hypothetical protein